MRQKHYFLYSLLLICFLFFFTSSHAQNLIPNGDFELGNYNGGSDAIDYYSGVACYIGRDRFDSDIDNWYVAKPAETLNSRCSPDWIPAGQLSLCPPNDSKFIRSASNKESIMTEMVGGYTLVKGRTYKFKVKVRAPLGLIGGTGSFQVVFSKKNEGLRVQPHKKWTALSIPVEETCEWRNIEAYFTVPTDNSKDYEDMKYIVLQYNHGQNYVNGETSISLILHYDEVSLVEEEKCVDVRYIQDWQYYDIHKIEQANVEIRAGANVSPYAWENNGPVIVKSSAKVIYRAPTVYLEPGFFVEEPGSYFETQVGTCVDDPCPDIVSYTPPPSVMCSSPITLGEDIPATPGVFYTWEPAEYFSNPWSRITDFTSPVGEGCIDAKLTIWTICGDLQEFPFSVNYIDSSPVINVNTVTSGGSSLDIDLNIENASNYTVTVTNTSGTVIYEDEQSASCENVSANDVSLNFTPCLVNMCDDINVTVTASNDCFGETQEVFNWIAPTPTAPTIDVTNINSDDFDYEFDLAIPNTYEYFTIETWNASQTSLLCSNTYSACDYPELTSHHFNIKNCLTGCVSQCEDYTIVVKMKNYCNDSVTTETLSWNKTTTTFAMPTSYPNVITLNGDGINDTLCFSPQAADFYHIVVVNRWGNLIYEASGCVTANPVCIWTPNTNLNDGTYYYTIEFSNQCGQSGSNHNFVQLFNDYNKTLNTTENEEIDTTEVSVYPNPSKGLFNVEMGSISNASLSVLDITGKVIVSKNAVSNRETLDLSNFTKGVYFLKIETSNHLITKKLMIE